MAARRPERRRHPRVVPRQARVWLVSGEFDELYTTVNFGRRLVNAGMGGACVETTGRLRPDVKMSLEVKFDELHGSLRSAARIVWVHTRTEGGNEIHTAGLAFTGELEATQPVRAFLKGEDPRKLLAAKEAEYRSLKREAEERKASGGKRRRGGLRVVALSLVLVAALYIGAFGGLVLLGRQPSSSPGLRFRYPEGGAALDVIFRPAYELLRRAGLPLVHDPS